MTIFAVGPYNLKGVRYLTYFFAVITHSPNPTFVSNLIKIGDLS